MRVGLGMCVCEERRGESGAGDVCVCEGGGEVRVGLVVCV